MMKLAEKYGDRPDSEFPMLFQRILQNTVRDHYRRQKVRNTWTTLWSAMVADEDADDFDPLESFSRGTDIEKNEQPAPRLEQKQVIEIIEKEIKKLPPRQREAFLLRYWEEMDVAETAVAMGCSEGSVKTHCSRATHSLAAALKSKGIEL
jgi:RNA polymerase sigma-70 factor (ECF subfamily)